MSCENCDKTTSTSTTECTCKNVTCPFHGRCCECIANHRPNLPNCCEELEKKRLYK